MTTKVDLPNIFDTWQNSWDSNFVNPVPTPATQRLLRAQREYAS